MSESMKFVIFLLNAGMLAVVCGGGFALGCAAVCRLIKWSPVNITVNSYSAPASEENAA